MNPIVEGTGPHKYASTQLNFTGEAKRAMLAVPQGGDAEAGKTPVEVEFMAMQDNYGKRAWHMQMTCRSSRSVFFQMELTPEQFIDMMSNRMFKATVSLNTENVGKTMERRIVEITIDPAGRRAIANVSHEHRLRPENDLVVRRHLLRLCKRVMPTSDGWVPNLDDFTNYHRRREDNRQAVAFHRFVDSPSRGTR